MALLDPSVLVDDRGPVTALLGPTNTGKTHRAIERMLEHETGAMGLPLRLLAREVYDRVTMRVGESQVALITGEEKRVPRAPRYVIATVEAMPLDREVDFLAVDEVQLASHPDRGHVFTSRLLGARGRKETWFLGAESMRSMFRSLLPEARFEKSPRLSRLTAAGSTSLGGLPKRSAVVAFSEARVFELAARLKARRGGAAVVMGALSPRARNAQVALYQSGEVEYLVATDAIGMGLNLDVDHVAFADTSKFDGREERELTVAELAQIAGRAGRYTRDGTFGTLAPLPPLPDGVARAIEEHRFPSVRALEWRNDALDFSSLDALWASLVRRVPTKDLRRAERCEDMQALKALMRVEEVVRRCVGPEEIALLWAVCSVPDYKKVLFEDHAALLSRLFLELSGPRGRIPREWLDRELARLRTPPSELDGLMGRVADVRLWNYVVHQADWVDDAAGYREQARAIEDTLSDALHGALVARFVDPAAKRGRKRVDAPKGSPFAALSRLIEVEPAEPTAADLVGAIADAPHSAFSVDARGAITFEGTVVGRLVGGRDPTSPDVVVTLEVDGGARLRLNRRLVAFARDLKDEIVGGLPRDLSAAGRGLVHVLTQHLGSALSRDVADQLAALEVEDRRALARAGVVLGRVVVYDPRTLKPAMLAKRASLALAASPVGAPPLPDGRAVSIAVRPGHEPRTLLSVGYPVVGPRAVRADVLERLAGRLAGATDDAATARAASMLGCKLPEAAKVVEALADLAAYSAA
jgi:ATP-dependent RNA helicase SUPV3L1/SUV3